MQKRSGTAVSTYHFNAEDDHDVDYPFVSSETENFWSTGQSGESCAGASGQYGTAGKSICGALCTTVGVPALNVFHKVPNTALLSASPAWRTGFAISLELQG